MKELTTVEVQKQKMMIPERKREEVENPNHGKSLTVKTKLHVATQGNKRIGPSGEAGCGKAVHQG